MNNLKYDDAWYLLEAVRLHIEIICDYVNTLEQKSSVRPKAHVSIWFEASEQIILLDLAVSNLRKISQSESLIYRRKQDEKIVNQMEQKAQEAKEILSTLKQLGVTGK